MRHGASKARREGAAQGDAWGWRSLHVPWAEWTPDAIRTAAIALWKRYHPGQRTRYRERFLRAFARAAGGARVRKVLLAHFSPSAIREEFFRDNPLFAVVPKA